MKGTCVRCKKETEWQNENVKRYYDDQCDECSVRKQLQLLKDELRKIRDQPIVIHNHYSNPSSSTFQQPENPWRY